MADKRPKRQRTGRSCMFFDASLQHREEIELRRALNESLKEARSAQQKHEEPAQPSAETRSICTNTETRLRLKKPRGPKLKKCSKTRSLEIKQNEGVTKGSEPTITNEEVLAKSKDQKGDSAKWRKLQNKGSLSEKQQRKELQSPEKSDKVVKSNKLVKAGQKRELKIVLNKQKTNGNLFTCKKGNDGKKRNVVKSLTEKFNTASKDEKQPSTKCARRKQENNDQNDIETCNDQVKKRKITPPKLVPEVLLKTEKTLFSVEERYTSDISALKQEVSDVLQGKLRKKHKQRLKDRKLVSPLGEIYIPANTAKTEDFLTFLCLRGSASLPRSFEVFNNPDPFFTQPTQQFPDEEGFSSPMLHTQSSVTYSPPSSSSLSEFSADSPMSSIDGWL